ncbi:hypothetical protein EXIGLDRAFT_726676 [Exidia glandulosa HHB12029]|uniref:F-box domain-containing protein n=1 Tax=Exidia glandulosa HHB12029 TaxID=1314781 RepID=A0A165ZQ57_EXIGL|nr:hypothetical protein EXIGLDRAFT_726676 [Exidia glandulosa HHB12029]
MAPNVSPTLQEPFAQLPLEIVWAIVTIAARNSISTGNRQWVAQSLSVVCKVFRDAAEPVLVESVWIWRENRAKIDGVRPGRFARTKHLYIDENSHWRPEGFLEGFPFPSLEALTGTIFGLQNIVLAPCDFPPRLTLHSVEAWSLVGIEVPRIDSLCGVTHLRLNNYVPQMCPLELLPATVTHLILTPARWPRSNTGWSDGTTTVELEDQIARILSNSRLRLARVLICLSDMRRDNAIRVMAHMRRSFAASSCDARLWVDEACEDGLSSAQKELLDPAQTVIWYTGHPLHAQSP